jgi:hypothetical protein
MKKYITGTLFALTLVLAPQTSEAYRLIDTSATQFSDSTILFTITYQLGYGRFGMEAPVGAVESDADASPYLTYGIYDKDENQVNEGTFSAIVLSDATYKDAQYILEAGVASVFTLVALYTAPEGTNVEDYFLKVRSLPFTLVDDGSKIQNGLSAGELRTYTTKK